MVIHIYIYIYIFLNHGSKFFFNLKIMIIHAGLYVLLNFDLMTNKLM